MAHSEEVKAKVLQLSRAGVAQREIAKRLGLSPSTVCTWLRKAPDLGAELEPEAVLPELAAPPSAPVDAPQAAAGGTPEEIMRRVLSRLEALVAAAEAQGNTRAATQLAVQLAKLGNDLARVSAQGGDEGVIKMNTAEIDAAMKAVTDRFAVLERVPVTCRKCGREMRVRIASDGAASE